MTNRLIRKWLDLKSSITTENLQRRAMVCSTSNCYILNLLLLKSELMLALKHSRLTWFQTLAFLFTLLMEDKITITTITIKRITLIEPLYELSFLMCFLTLSPP